MPNKSGARGIHTAASKVLSIIYDHDHDHDYDDDQDNDDGDYDDNTYYDSHHCQMFQGHVAVVNSLIVKGENVDATTNVKNLLRR